MGTFGVIWTMRISSDIAIILLIRQLFKIILLTMNVKKVLQYFPFQNYIYIYIYYIYE